MAKLILKCPHADEFLTHESTFAATPSNPDVSFIHLEASTHVNNQRHSQKRDHTTRTSPLDTMCCVTHEWEHTVVWFLGRTPHTSHTSISKNHSHPPTINHHHHYASSRSPSPQPSKHSGSIPNGESNWSGIFRCRLCRYR